MAFLDNSGDIILDAVLTDTGRRKMANGTFNITKFALGDDEIDYSLYNKNHPSGSAYYDLEILQTPVFEATTQTHAGINYGLLATTATDLLYLPTMHINTRSQLVNNYPVVNSGSNGMFYVTDTSNDTTGETIAGILGSGSVTSYMDGTNSATSMVLLETGLNTGWDAVPVGTMTNRKTYLVSNDLIDSSVYVFYDNRFISGIRGLTAGSRFSATNVDTVNVALNLTNGATSTISTGLDNYSAATVGAIANNIFRSTDSSANVEQTYSVIAGPRANAIGVSPIIKAGLDAEYARYGTLNSTVGGFITRHIDTTIYVQGILTPGTIQIPIRIIRRG